MSVPTQAKIFSDNRRDRLEDKLEDWFQDEQPNIVDVDFTGESPMNVLVLYT